MIENITSQSVSSGFRKPLTVAFDQPAGTTDGGAVLLQVLDDRASSEPDHTIHVEPFSEGERGTT